jgi:hypothetical protein
MRRAVPVAVICGWILGLLCRTALAVPDYWDPRLNQVCQLQLIDVAAQVPSGQGYWRLIDGRFEDETESNQNHNIYIKCLQSDGSPIYNQKIFTAWPYGFIAVDENQCKNDDHWACDYTKGPGIDDYWGNMPMWYRGCPAGNCGWDYTAFVSEHSGAVTGLIGLSDKVIGMGLHNPSGTPCNAHVNFRFIYKWTVPPTPRPTISRSPISFTRSVQEGQNLPNDTFTIWNSGGQSLAYSITDNAGWLSETPATGTCSTETDTITIQYGVNGLPPGNYSATITISDPNSTNGSETILVNLTVLGLVIPGDFDNDKDVDQADFGRFQACYTGNGYEQTEPSCAKARLDYDNDVDQADFTLFAACMTGPGVQGTPECAQGG